MGRRGKELNWTPVVMAWIHSWGHWVNHLLEMSCLSADAAGEEVSHAWTSHSHLSSTSGEIIYSRERKGGGTLASSDLSSSSLPLNMAGVSSDNWFWKRQFLDQGQGWITEWTGAPLVCKHGVGQDWTYSWQVYWWESVALQSLLVLRPWMWHPSWFPKHRLGC